MAWRQLVKRLAVNNQLVGISMPEPVPGPVIDRIEEAFLERYGVCLPAGYKELLSVADGLCGPYGGFFPALGSDRQPETLLAANDNLRDEYSDAYVYFGSLYDTLLCLDVATGQCCQMDIGGMNGTEPFESFEDMRHFGLALLVG